MPAIYRPALAPFERRLRLVALGLAVLLGVSLSVVASSPTQARDWTPQIKVARGAQIHWEAAMRAADADVRAARKAKRRTKAGLSRARARLEVAVERRQDAKRMLAASRGELRGARTELRLARAAFEPARAVPLARPDIRTAAVALRLSDVDTAGRPALGLGWAPVAAITAADERDLGDPVAEKERRASQLAKRVKKHKHRFGKATRKARHAARALRVTRSRLASLKRQERAAVARREQAERNLGSWILTMERYAHGRAENMSKYRPGIDSRFAWPARGRISQGYSRRHDGIDIAGYQGTPIRAAAFGVVAYIGWNPWDEHKRAFMIVLAHRGGLETLYGHVLPRRSVRIGEAVRQGQIIGYLGNTGNSTGPHLHFEVRRGRTTVNPLGYL